MTLVGTTAASVWGDFFHQPDDEAVLDNTLAYVRWMYSEWEGLSGWKGFPDGRAFRMDEVAEDASRNLPLEWDGVSG